MPRNLEACATVSSPWRPYTRGVLAAALGGGFLNFASSLPDHPRAFASFAAVLAPLALSVAGFLLLALVVFGVLGPLLRLLRVPPGPTAVTLAIPVVLGGVLVAVLEGLARELSPMHAPVVWGLGFGTVVCAAVAGGLVARRLAFVGDRLGVTASLGTAELALETALALWLLDYPLAGASAALRLAVLAGWIAAMAASLCGLWRTRRVRPCAAMTILLAAVFLAPLAGRFVEPTAVPARDPGAPPAGSPRCIVLFTVDTLRADMIGGGEGAAPTPALDSLLADSVVFTGARSAAPWTKPSVASILTGLSPLVHGATNRRTRLPDEVHTIAEYMHDAGYTTVGVGLNVHLERLFHFNQGFDEYFFPARDDYGISLGAKILRRLDAPRYPELFPTTTAITDRALERLAALGDRPFFLWVHVLDPHWPYEPPPEFTPAPDPASRIGARWGDHETVTNVQAGNVKLGAADRARVRDLYRGEIEYVDANADRLLGFLREHGLYDDALIVFTSDHGEEFWEHGRFEHGRTMYDEVLRVPLAIKLPHSEVVRTVEQVVSNESLTPTLLDYLGLDDAGHPFTSPSLAGYLGEDEPDTRVMPIYGAGTYYYGEQQMVLVDGMKTIVDLETGRVELFDLRSDPGERESLTSSRPRDVKRGADLLRTRAAEAKRLRTEMGLKEAEVLVNDDVDRALRKIGYGGGARDEHD